ncbi:WD repeat-containing protein [Reticulomyxa filosa]|uniref:WD repeat-containing protein n=1 Tax=Reticulomyxa filosa TaxID=46433 RepID=X6NNT8_RETFI|nr:WD repeat-containing protein [Reticulomyxa filosa]|eukprot:ETO27681.1 WD repeat-containing protein [Reticulomyxa filosa]
MYFNFKKKKKREKEIDIVLESWLRLSYIRWGWINEFNKFIAEYVHFFFFFFFFDNFQTNKKKKKKKIKKCDRPDISSNIKFSPDGHTIASTGSYGVSLQSVESGKEIKNYNNGMGWATKVHFSVDGKMIIAPFDNRQVRIWKIGTETIPEIRYQHSERVTGAHFSSDNKTAVSSSADGKIWLWNVDTMSAIKQLGNALSYITDVKFSLDDKKVAVSTVDKTIQLWNVESGKITLELKGHEDVVTSVQFSPVNSTIASSSKDIPFDYGIRYQGNRLGYSKGIPI